MNTPGVTLHIPTQATSIPLHAPGGRAAGPGRLGPDAVGRARRIAAAGGRAGLPAHPRARCTRHHPPHGRAGTCLLHPKYTSHHRTYQCRGICSLWLLHAPLTASLSRQHCCVPAGGGGQGMARHGEGWAECARSARFDRPLTDTRTGACARRACIVALGTRKRPCGGPSPATPSTSSCAPSSSSAWAGASVAPPLRQSLQRYTAWCHASEPSLSHNGLDGTAAHARMETKSCMAV